MALLPMSLEWVVIGAIIVILLFRPKSVTELARSLGQVVAEYRKSRQDTQQGEGKEELLAETAEKLGIRTEGKTPSQIREEILAKVGRDES